jgi:hypothetical protein
MQKWEYKSLPMELGKEIEVMLQRLGDDGWELATVVPTNASEYYKDLTGDAVTTRFTFFFKRPKP